MVQVVLDFSGRDLIHHDFFGGGVFSRGIVLCDCAKAEAVEYDQTEKTGKSCDRTTCACSPLPVSVCSFFTPAQSPFVFLQHHTYRIALRPGDVAQ